MDQKIERCYGNIKLKEINEDFIKTPMEEKQLTQQALKHKEGSYVKKAHS